MIKIKCGVDPKKIAKVKVTHPEKDNLIVIMKRGFANWHNIIMRSGPQTPKSKRSPTIPSKKIKRVW